MITINCDRRTMYAKLAINFLLGLQLHLIAEGVSNYRTEEEQKKSRVMQVEYMNAYREIAGPGKEDTVEQSLDFADDRDRRVAGCAHGKGSELMHATQPLESSGHQLLSFLPTIDPGNAAVQVGSVGGVPVGETREVLCVDGGDIQGPRLTSLLVMRRCWTGVTHVPC